MILPQRRINPWRTPGGASINLQYFTIGSLPASAVALGIHNPPVAQLPRCPLGGRQLGKMGFPVGTPIFAPDFAFAHRHNGGIMLVSRTVKMVLHGQSPPLTIQWLSLAGLPEWIIPLAFLYLIIQFFRKMQPLPLALGLKFS